VGLQSPQKPPRPTPPPPQGKYPLSSFFDLRTPCSEVWQSEKRERSTHVVFEVVYKEVEDGRRRHEHTRAQVEEERVEVDVLGQHVAWCSPVYASAFVCVCATLDAAFLPASMDADSSRHAGTIEAWRMGTDEADDTRTLSPAPPHCTPGKMQTACRKRDRSTADTRQEHPTLRTLDTRSTDDNVRRVPNHGGRAAKVGEDGLGN